MFVRKAVVAHQKCEVGGARDGVATFFEGFF